MRSASEQDAAAAAQQGDALVALFERIESLPDKAGWVSRRITDALGAGPAAAPALARACAAVADRIDAEAGHFDRLAYHNRQHFCEVALTAHLLCRLEGLDAEATCLVLLGALVHDLVHDGGPQAPFVLERASVERARPMLEAAGASAGQIGRLQAMVLATDFGVGTRFAAAARDWHGRDAAVAPTVPAAAVELALLLADPTLAQLARVLCEADLLPSLGLTLAHAMRLQERLALERNQPMDDADKLAFIDLVLSWRIVGPVFRPNVLRVRDALDRRDHALASR